MSYLINLKVKGRKCLVVGGGNIAARKIKDLIEARASVYCISPEFCEEIIQLERNVPELTLVKWKFRKSDLEDIWLVIAATDNEILNSEICTLAEEKNILANSVTSCEKSTFMNTAAFTYRGFTIGISSDGTHPELVKILKKTLQECLHVSHDRGTNP